MLVQLWGRKRGGYLECEAVYDDYRLERGKLNVVPKRGAAIRRHSERDWRDWRHWNWRFFLLAAAAALIWTPFDLVRLSVLEATSSCAIVIALACWGLATFIVLALEHRAFERIDTREWAGRRRHLTKVGHGIAMVLAYAAITACSLIWLAHWGWLSDLMLIVVWAFLWAADRLVGWPRMPDSV